MSEPKFTPGPWTFSRELSALDVHPIKEDDDTDICTLNPNGRNGDGSEIPFANAYLIAAAPDLYEALELVLKWYTLHEGDLAGVVEARAALAKARGES